MKTTAMRLNALQDAMEQKRTLEYEVSCLKNQLSICQAFLTDYECECILSRIDSLEYDIFEKEKLCNHYLTVK